ncbi:MAG: T9SS type A sorting domain-containing protein, partial [Chitinophagales bacterium]|nr:T9SS type A sorting domain-containing protein [Chitinophagales bacterium]
TYREEYDTTAVRIYKENLPGYKIATIDCDNSGGNIIAALGAVHCITKEIGQSDPIWIDHAPLLNTTDAVNPYLVEAKIETPTGITNATMYWTIDTSVAYAALTMIAEPTDSFYAYIPAQPAGTQIFYYITAESNSGRMVSKPLTAPDGWMRFTVEGASAISYTNTTVILFDVYPNPVSSNATIAFSLAQSANCTLLINDVLGRTVKEITNENLQQGIHKFNVNTTTLAAGIYEVVLKAEGNIFVKRMVVK